MFKANRKPENGRKMQEVEVDRTSCTYSFKKEQVMSTDEAWGHCIIALYFGRFAGMKVFDEMRASWKVPNQYMFHPSGYTLFKFENAEDRASVLANGPYSILGVPWMMKELPPYFQCNDDCFSNIPVWVKFPSLPLELFGEEALNIVASFVGKPLLTDQCTKDMTKGGYARALIEVNASQSLVREIELEMPNGKKFVQLVQYETEPKWCLKCRTLGHCKEECQGKTHPPRGRSNSRKRSRSKLPDPRHNRTATAVNPQTTAVVTGQKIVTLQNFSDNRGHSPTTAVNPSQKLDSLAEIPDNRGPPATTAVVTGRQIENLKTLPDNRGHSTTTAVIPSQQVLPPITAEITAVIPPDKMTKAVFSPTIQLAHEDPSSHIASSSSGTAPYPEETVVPETLNCEAFPPLLASSPVSFDSTKQKQWADVVRGQYMGPPIPNGQVWKLRASQLSPPLMEEDSFTSFIHGIASEEEAIELEEAHARPSNGKKNKRKKKKGNKNNNNPNKNNRGRGSRRN